VEVHQVGQIVMAAQTDQIVQLACSGECLDDSQQLLTIMDSTDLLREQLGIVQREREQCLANGGNVGADLVPTLEQIAVVLDVIAELGGEFVVVVAIGFVELGLDVREVDYVALTEKTMAAIDACQRLQQVVVFDDAAEVQFLQAWRVESLKQHVEYEH